MSESPLAPHGSTPAELKERHEALRTGMPHLVFRDGEGRQVLVPLDGQRERLTIGRRPENDIALPWDHRASRLHAQLERAGGEWVLADEGLSSNGTWVGAARLVGRRRLKDGEVVRVGGTLIAFRDPGPTPVGPTSADDSQQSLPVSPAQRRVLVALCRPALAGGAYAAPPSNAELAGQLHLSVDAIKTHLRGLFEAFELADVPPSQKRATLIERALRIGVVTEHDLA